MKTVKILHTADLHLGSDFPSLGRKGPERATELISSFRRMLDYCRREDIDLLLIAGDFLESATIKGEELGLIRDLLAGLESTELVISPGNHDYYSPDSPYALEWPEGVHIIRKRLESLVLLGGRVRLFGSAFLSSYNRESSLAGFSEMSRDELDELYREKEDGVIFLGLFHGDIHAGEAGRGYNPIRMNDLPRGLFDYIALGHIHKRTEICYRGSTAYAYSGNPDPTSFSDSDLKGAYAGKVGRGVCDLHFIPFSSRLFMRVDVDLTGAEGYREMAERIRKVLAETGEDYRKNYYRIRLCGMRSGLPYFSLPVLMDDLAEDLPYLDIIDDSMAAFDREAISRDGTLRGSFIRSLLMDLDEAEKDGDFDRIQVIKRALQTGLSAFDQEDCRVH